MSHGGPPPPSQSESADIYGFGSMAVDSQDPADLMAFLDTSLFPQFSSVPMNLDGDDSVFASPPDQDGNLLSVGDQTFQSPAPGEPVSGKQMGSSNSLAQSSPAPGVSTVTEFTKRRNWPAKVVEELKDFLYILDANGRIKYVSPSLAALTSYTAEEIVGTFLKDLIHPDDEGVFVAELNESIASGNPLRVFYRFKNKDASYSIFEAVGHAHIAAAKFAPNPHNQSPFCQAVFMMARPYPTRNASLLDSFLEHKMENERLRRRIAELRREEEADEQESQRQWKESDTKSELTQSEPTLATPSTGATLRHGAAGDRPGPASDGASALNVALTRENLEGVVAGSRPDSLRDKMARYEGSSHTDAIEMLTGLKYIEGERSHGITTGNASPTLIKGDAGIAIPMDRDPRTGDKKKKQKVSEEYVCTDCGTLDSPEWRKGPSGPKTLCNACGLRWAKKEKKKSMQNAAAGNHDAAVP